MMLEQMDIHMPSPPPKKNFSLYHVWYIKIKSELIIDLNVKTKIRKLLGENIRENFCDVGLGKDFLDTASKVWFIK